MFAISKQRSDGQMWLTVWKSITCHRTSKEVSTGICVPKFCQLIISTDDTRVNLGSFMYISLHMICTDYNLTDVIYLKYIKLYKCYNKKPISCTEYLVSAYGSKDNEKEKTKSSLIKTEIKGK